MLGQHQWNLGTSNLSFKGRRGSAEHKGIWNSELPFPCSLAVPCSPQSLCTPAQYAGVGEADSILPAVCCCSCWGHSPLHAAYYIRVLSGGHWAGPPWRPKRFLNEVAYWEIPLSSSSYRTAVLITLTFPSAELSGSPWGLGGGI